MCVTVCGSGYFLSFTTCNPMGGHGVMTYTGDDASLHARPVCAVLCQINKTGTIFYFYPVWALRVSASFFVTTALFSSLWNTAPFRKNKGDPTENKIKSTTNRSNHTHTTLTQKRRPRPPPSANPSKRGKIYKTQSERWVTIFFLWRQKMAEANSKEVQAINDAVRTKYNEHGYPTIPAMSASKQQTSQENIKTNTRTRTRYDRTQDDCTQERRP